jgi:hypothetical protein
LSSCSCMSLCGMAAATRVSRARGPSSCDGGRSPGPGRVGSRWARSRAARRAPRARPERAVGSAPLRVRRADGRRALTDGRVAVRRRVRRRSPVAAGQITMPAVRGSVARVLAPRSTWPGGRLRDPLRVGQPRASVWLDGRARGAPHGAYLPFEVRAPPAPGATGWSSAPTGATRADARRGLASHVVQLRRPRARGDDPAGSGRASSTRRPGHAAGGARRRRRP